MRRVQFSVESDYSTRRVGMVGLSEDQAEDKYGKDGFQNISKVKVSV